jgi:hypothetical protein
VPDGVIAHLTRECGGNVHDHNVVEGTWGSFEHETQKASNIAKNAADVRIDSDFASLYREKRERIPDTRNNWLCYDFKERRIVPTHYAVRTNPGCPGSSHLKSWLVETSVDGENWQEVAREEDNEQLNGKFFTGTFAVADRGECRFIRLVNIVRSHAGTDDICIFAWEIFGSLFE